MERARISVIMPCYNAEKYLCEAVECVLNQTYSNVELIVIDDGSTDRSRELLESYADRIVFLAQENNGPYAARNRGLQHVTGNFVAFLDADDWWDHEFLEKLYSALEESPDCALAYCGWQNVGAKGRSNEPFIPRDYESANKIELLLTGGSPWPIHAALVRREAINQIDGFREDLPTSLDYEFWLRLAADRRILLVPEVLSYYRFHGDGQISSRPWRQAINGWKIKKRFLEANPDAARVLGDEKIRELVDRGLLLRGYQHYWRRDLASAQHIFRKSLTAGGWKWSELVHLVPALLPDMSYRFLIGIIDRRRR